MRIIGPGGPEQSVVELGRSVHDMSSPSLTLNKSAKKPRPGDSCQFLLSTVAPAQHTTAVTVCNCLVFHCCAGGREGTMAIQSYKKSLSFPTPNSRNTSTAFSAKTP